MDHETSNELGELAKALVAAQLAMKPAVKDAKNPHLKNKYADLGSVRDAVMPALLANGIAVTQGACTGQAEHVAVVTQLTHTSGQWMRARIEVPYQEQKGTNIAQAFGSALSYARRYALLALVCGAAEDDDGAGAAPARTPQATSDDDGPILEAIASAADVETLAKIAARLRNPSQRVKDAYHARKNAVSKVAA